MSRSWTLATVVGARPQFIKASAFSARWKSFGREILIHTGQHFDDNMSNVFFRELDLPKVDYHLATRGGNRFKRIEKMAQGIVDILFKIKPDAILVYGDTDSTLAGALASIPTGLPLFHVEAGLRSYVKTMPEEANRVAADHASVLLFAPSPQALRNLNREGIRQGVHVVGDVMLDAVQDAVKKMRAGKAFRTPEYPFGLVTIHRAATTDHAPTLRRLCRALNELPIPVVWPVHPRTQQAIRRFRIRLGGRVIPTPPISYLESLSLQMAADVILTDSGGIQREAYFLRKPCVTLRHETEWSETLATGHNVLGGTQVKSIQSATLRAIRNQQRPWPALFGRGDASTKIAKIIRAYLQKNHR